MVCTPRRGALRFLLFKAQLLIALYSMRSDRLFCEQLDYKLLFCWSIDLDL